MILTSGGRQDSRCQDSGPRGPNSRIWSSEPSTPCLVAEVLTPRLRAARACKRGTQGLYLWDLAFGHFLHPNTGPASRAHIPLGQALACSITALCLVPCGCLAPELGHANPTAGNGLFRGSEYPVPAPSGVGGLYWTQQWSNSVPSPSTASWGALDMLYPTCASVYIRRELPPSRG